MVTATEVRKAAIRDAEAEIRAILGRLENQHNVRVRAVRVLVQDSTFEVEIAGH